MKRLVGTCAAFGGLAALLLLSGCGIKSSLERPDPMWGTASAERAEAQRNADARAAREERAARSGVNPDATPQIPEPGPVAPSPTPPATTPAPY